LLEQERISVDSLDGELTLTVADDGMVLMIVEILHLLLIEKV
jgi:hypothetical protein